MQDLVHLLLKRNRGWPFPEESWGLTPMFGEDGWCHSCGTPLRAQCGPLTLTRKGLSPLNGAFVANWRFDAFCMEDSIAKRVAEQFRVALREVAWKGTPPGSAMQIIAPTVGPSWYDPEALTEAATKRHGAPGKACPECHTWRWFPLSKELLPPLSREITTAETDVAASPEWFGDGFKSFRQILFRRRLAELLVEASPRDFRIQEPK